MSRVPATPDELTGIRQIISVLAAARKRLGLSQATVATLMGTSQSAVSDIERLEVEPRLSTLQRYAASVGGHLQLSVEDLDGVS